MRTIVAVCFAGCLAACAWAAAPTMDLTGTWQVRLGEADQPVDVTLPGTLGDAKLGPAAKKAVYGALTPRHQYVGPATYTRTVTVSPDMKGDYELFLERVMWKSTASWDGTPLGECDSLATPHVYTIPEKLLTPGTHRLTLTIDSTIQAFCESILKKGVEQFDVEDGGFCAPFGVSQISYRFTVTGRMKQSGL